MKKLNKKGFTLAELLIVVAIIAVLVAISIPVFSAQLEKSREAVDLANIRAAYAEVMTSAVTDSQKTEGKVTYDSAAKTYSYEVELTQKQDGWQTTVTDVKIGEVSLDGSSPKASGTATVSYNVTKSTASVEFSK